MTKSRHLIIQVFSIKTRYLYRPAVSRRENFIVNWLIKKWTLNLLISKLTCHCWCQHYKERFQNASNLIEKTVYIVYWKKRNNLLVKDIECAGKKSLA